MKLFIFQEYKVLINDHTTTIDVRKIRNSEPCAFECKFNIEKHKDSINGLEAPGFFVDVEDNKTNFLVPIKTEKSILTEELLQDIWKQIMQQEQTILDLYP